MFKHLISMLHYPKTGRNQQIATIPWISSDFNNFTSPELLQTPGQLTTFWYDDFGNTFTCKQCAHSGAITQGDVCSWSGTAAVGNPWSTDTATGASTVRVITLTTGGLTNSAEINNFVYDATLALSTDRLKLIKANTASTLTVSNIDTRISNLQNDPDAYSVAPANADALTIIRPHRIQTLPTANATTALPTGIAVQSISVDNWGFMQVDGLALVSSAGNVTAIVAGAPVVPDGVTAGRIKGSAAVAANQVGTAAAAYAANGGLSPIWLDILAGA